MFAGFLLAGLACSSHIQQQYDQEKAAVLQAAPPAPVAADWVPDVQVRIRPEGLQDISSAAMEAGLLAWNASLSVDGPLGLSAELTPQASVSQLRLSPGERCADCLAVSADLQGAATWRIAGVEGSLPFSARLGGVLKVALVAEGQAQLLQARLGEISSLSIEVGDLRRLVVDDALGAWTRKAVLAAPTFTIATLGGADLPLRAARLRIQPEAVTVEALTTAAHSAPVALAAGPLHAGSDWEVRASAETILSLARVAAFEAGTLAYSVAVDPRALTVEDHRLTLGLRLWRLAGRGWWRDYTVACTLRVRGRKLELEADDAVEGEKSPGAGLADPLALLAEGRILDAITDNLQQAVPGSRSAAFGDVRVQALTNDLLGEQGALVLRGELRVQHGAPAETSSP